MSTFVFFVQLEPDVDHVAPLAYRLNQEQPGSVTIVCMNPMFDLYADHRLPFLRSQGVTVLYLSEIGACADHRFAIGRVICRWPKFLLKLVPPFLWPKLYPGSVVLSPAGLKGFFLKNHTKVVTIDEGLPRPIMIPLLDTAKSMGLVTVRIPTANNVLKVQLAPDPTEGKLKIDFQLRPHRLAPLGPLSAAPTQERVLGCMRYCEEWEKINSRLVSEVPGKARLPLAKGKLKVLIFERSTQGFTQDHSAVRKLYGLDYCEVLFRSRPRILQPRNLYADTLDALPSALLIQWADVVVCSVTSIAVDVLYYKKPLLYAKFVAPKQSTTYEDLGACWKLESEAELLEAIRKIHHEKAVPAYSDEKVQNFFREAVYGGDRQRDVLGGYAHFYLTAPRPAPASKI